MTCPLSDDHGTLVSPADSEALLSAVARRTVNAREGIFGPTSTSWKINRESALFLGAGRAALLQLAHPWVATALVEHSSLMAQPIARFHNTFRIVFTMIFGSVDQALAAARHLYALHTRIGGAMPEDVAAYKRGSPYEANEIAALRWVFATLIESAVLAYECVRGELADGERADFYDDSRKLAALFGLPEAALPPDWASFEAYCSQMGQSNALGVSGKARSMAHDLLSGAGSWIHPPHWYRALTAAWMPERLRQEFALEFGVDEVRAVERARRWLPRIYTRLPAAVRFVGPWHEAQTRLNRCAPGIIVRASNRFWIGTMEMPFGNEISSHAMLSKT